MNSNATRLACAAAVLLAANVAIAADAGSRAFCDESHVYRSNRTDPVEEASMLGLEAKISACQLGSVLKLKEREALYMRAYDLDKREFRYQIVDFNHDPPTEITCTAHLTFEHVPGGEWDAQREVFAPPECTKPIVAR